MQRYALFSICANLFSFHYVTGCCSGGSRLWPILVPCGQPVFHGCKDTTQKRPVQAPQTGFCVNFSKSDVIYASLFSVFFRTRCQYAAQCLVCGGAQCAVVAAEQRQSVKVVPTLAVG